jgi:hypothetical protein
MKTIVLITRENEERATQVSVYLCGNSNEAGFFRRFVNRLTLEGGDKLVARRALMNKEYSLEKYVPFMFEDITKLDDRTIQEIMRELDSQILGIAMKDAKEEVREKIFRNMSKRATAMLKEDMEYMDTPTEEDIENARQYVINIYLDLVADTFDETAAAYTTANEKIVEQWGIRYENNNIVLVFRGSNDIASAVSVSLFDTYEAADNFCKYLNELKPEKGTFIYARHADEMVEYETTKPLLVCFDQIFKNNTYGYDYVIRETLKNYSLQTLLQALKGLDKHSREIILHCLPIKTADEINESIEKSEQSTDYISLGDTRKARQKIINAINRNHKKFTARGGFGEVLKLTVPRRTKKARLIKQLNSLSAAEKEKVIAFFTKYPRYENRIDWNNKSLQYHDFERVFQAVDYFFSIIK